MKINAWSKTADGRLRLEFTVAGERCAAIVRPVEVVLDGPRLLIAIEQEASSCPPVTRWNADGTIDPAADLTKDKRRRA